MISKATKINNFIRVADHLDVKSNYKLADYFNKEAISLFKKALDIDVDRYSESDIRSKTIINWMLKHQREFGKPHEKKIYAPIVKIGEPRDVIGTEPSYYENNLDRVLDTSTYLNTSVIENIINHHPEITPEEMSYMLKLKKSGYFNENPINSHESVMSALHALNHIGIEKYKKESSQFAALAEILYTTNNLKFRNIPIEVLKEVYDQYSGMPINVSTIGIFERHLSNYIYYGTPWRNNKENINIPYNINSNEVDLYKNAYHFAKEHENDWGNDYSGKALRSYVGNRIYLERDKSDKFKIAKTFYALNYSTYELEENLIRLQNSIHKIYRFPPNTPENDRLLIFFSKYKNTIGIPLSAVESIETLGKSASPEGSEIAIDLPRVLNVFGKNWQQWVAKFDGDIHNAAQILPTSGKHKELKDIGLFLLQYYGKYDTTTLTMISNGWKELTPEEKQLPIDQLANIVFQKKAKNILSGNHINNMDFAMEAAKWWQENKDNSDENDREENEENEEDEEELTYSSLEKLYLDSQNVPLPKWAENNTATIGNLTGRFLPRSDPRGMFLGMYSNSCQHPWNVGDDCAYHGQSSPHGAFFVVENNKTQEIIAQSWVWEDKDGDVVFDNVEANGIGPVRMPIVQQIYQQVANNMKGRLVHIGEGGSDLDIEHLRRANPIKTPSGLYSDASIQRILADNTGDNT